MVRPRISNKLRGSLGEIYYKEYCDQKGWAYTSLENIYETMNPEWIFTFKKGFHRIRVKLPQKIRDEVDWLASPSNRNSSSPSFVFDFLACKVGTSKNYSGVKSGTQFAWVECKTGKTVFTMNQINTMSKINLPLAIFHVDDVIESPKKIDMDWDIKQGNQWLDVLDQVDNEIYELAKA